MGDFVQANSPQAERIGYIDFLKGAACIIMLISHTMRMDIGDLSLPSKLWLMFHPPFAQLFFFASGMNIILFIERYQNRTDFKMDRYYLVSAAVLFFMGYTYSFARMSLITWQIFQGIAATTAMTYVLVRTRLSTLAHVLLAIFLYLIYLRFRIDIEPVLGWYRATLPTGPSGIHPEVLESLRVTTQIGGLQRALYTNFSLLPWVSYVLLGAVAFRDVREHPEHQRTWGIGFTVCLILGFVFAFWPKGSVFGNWYTDQAIDALYRHIPHHVLTAIGACGLVWLACHRWYPNVHKVKNKLGKLVLGYTEFMGVASFIFFIFHWVILLGFHAIWMKLHEMGYVAQSMNIHLRWFLACVIVLPLMIPAVKVGQLWGKRKHFVGEAVALMVVSIVVSLWLMARAMRLGTGSIQPAIFAAYGSCFSYAYLYPYIRGRLKKRYTIRPKKPKATAIPAETA